VFVPKHLRNDIENTKVEIVSLLFHKEGKAMVHSSHRENGDWDELKDKFYLAFFPISHIVSLPRAILDFEQNEESIGAA